MMKHCLGQKLYTLADVARAAGLDYSSVFVKARYTKTLPEPDVTLGHRCFYSEERFQKIVAECKARKVGRNDAK